MNQFFTFTRQEWIASVTLWSIVLVLIIIQYIVKPTPQAEGLTILSQQFNDFQSQQLILDSLHRQEHKAYHLKESRVDTPRKKLSEMYAIRKIELNSADTSAIMIIPQFGSKRANALVKYRDQLGGFYEWEQIQEVFILQSITIEFLQKYFTIDTTLVTPISVNNADYKTLVSHPYLDSYLTKSIINYRDNNGKITSMKQIQEATHAYPELIEKLTPYLIFE